MGFSQVISQAVGTSGKASKTRSAAAAKEAEQEEPVVSYLEMTDRSTYD